METSVIIAIIVGLVIMIAISGGLYASGVFDSPEPSPPPSCKTTDPPKFVPKYRLNDFSCRDPVNVPGSLLRGTVQTCEAACDNILACVGFDRRADVSDDQEAFCYLQMSHCGEKDADRKLSPDQEGNKWKRHVKP
jgi:hypothetical protein